MHARASSTRSWPRTGSGCRSTARSTRATIGGIVATNDAGPLRHRYGTPRDLLIGVTLALTDGRLVKAGGTVVKNVAGYDLGKLVSGSFGTLAAIVDATFKLLPMPQASATLDVDLRRMATALARDVMQHLVASQLEPVAFDVTRWQAGRVSAAGALRVEPRARARRRSSRRTRPAHRRLRRS